MKPVEQEQKDFNPLKPLIPICVALPFNMVILKNLKSGNCLAVTEDGECPHAKRRFHTPKKFKCDKNTLMKIDSPRLITQ